MHQPNHTKNSGFSVVEVLLSITITIILIDLIIHFCITLVNQHAFIKEKTVLAENAQFAEFILKREMQTAGFFGCNKLNQLDIHYHLTRSYLPITPIQIFSKNDPLPNEIHAESDVIVIQKMSEKTVNLLQQKNSTRIKASIENPVALGEPMVISDCKQADIFLPSSISYSRLFQTINTKQALHNAYTNALLGKLVTTAFFVAKTHRKNHYGQPIHALYSYDLINHRKIEWVSGVDGMEVSFGNWDNDDREIYFTSASNPVDLSATRLIKIVLSFSNEDSLFSKSETLHMKKDIFIFLRELA